MWLRLQNRLHASRENVVHRGRAVGDGDFVAALGIGFFGGDVPGAAVTVSGGGNEAARRELLGTELIFDKAFRWQVEERCVVDVQSAESDGDLFFEPVDPAEGHGGADSIGGRVLLTGQ